MSNKVRLVTVLVVVVMVAMVVEGQRNRKKPKEKKDLFWFKVAENSTSSCEDVNEDTLAETVVEGPPAESCQVQMGHSAHICHFWVCAASI